MWRVGIDVGGTFTDLFAWHTATGETREGKSDTTRDDLSRGVLAALTDARIEPSEIQFFIHGSTTATNALIERSYPEPALITTDGFRDTIEIGRQQREDLYEPYQTKPAPLVRRRNRYTVTEKIRADGSITRPLDEAEVRAVAEQIRDRGITNVAIAFLNSYVNRVHEDRARDIVVEVIPNAQIACSADLPKFRELGRFVTAVVRAALLPVMGGYLSSLGAALKSRGFEGTFYVIKSSGGVMHVDAAMEHPEELIESGPAGGAAAGAFMSALVKRDKVLSTDMGGTSFDVALIEDGSALIRDDYEFEWAMPIVVPMLDIRSVGSGGGSIAWVDSGGSLRVGPRSAGSSPGPACYGRGGVEPTVTDANLVLGRLDPMLGGKLKLDLEAAEAAIRTVAEPTGMDICECAEGIIRICAENMASAIKSVSIDRGRDPRDHALLSLGGAGAMHAWAIAPSVGIDTVLIPPFAGVASAFGATMMDVRHDIETTFWMPCREPDVDNLNREYERLEEEGRNRLRAEGFAEDECIVTRSAAMRYVGQSYEVNVPIPLGRLTLASIEQIKESFNAVHEQEHGVASDEFEIAFVSLRVTVIGEVSKLDPAALGHHGSSASNGHEATDVVKDTRQVYFDGAWVDTTILDGPALRKTESYDGPAIIEYAQSEIIVPPDATVEIDDTRTVLMTLALPEELR